QEQVAQRHPWRERVREHAHRPYEFGVGMAAAIDVAMADPDHRRRAGEMRPHDVTHRQPLDWHLTVATADPRSRRETGRRWGCRYHDRGARAADGHHEAEPGARPIRWHGC